MNRKQNVYRIMNNEPAIEDGAKFDEVTHEQG
jgi:hypothetical protein